MKGIEKSNSSSIYVLFIIVVLTWGLSWPVNKLGLVYVSPFWFAALRLIVGTVSMFLLIGFFILLINLALAIESSGTAAILVYTTPLWVTPMAIFFFKEANTALKWFGFILGIIGILFMLNPSELDWTNGNVLLAVFYLMGASLSLSISILCARYMTWHHTPLELIPWQLLVGSIILVIVALFMQPNLNMQWNVTSASCIVYTGLIATAFGFFGMSKISKELPATLTSIGLLGVPVSGVIFSVILLHESVDLFKILAMVFITLGVICVVFGEKKS